MHTYTYTHTHTHTHAHTHCPLDKLPPALAPLFRGKTNTLRGRRTLSIQCVCVCVSGSGSRTWSTLENTHSETESWGVMKSAAMLVGAMGEKLASPTPPRPRVSSSAQKC